MTNPLQLGLEDKVVTPSLGGTRHSCDISGTIVLPQWLFQIIKITILLENRCSVSAVEASLYLQLNAFLNHFPVKGNFTEKNGIIRFKNWRKCRQQEMIYLVWDQYEGLCSDQQKASCHRAT